MSIGVGEKQRCEPNVSGPFLQDLIETNIRQRGEVGGTVKKVAKRITELERIYGIQHGATSFQGNQHKEVLPNNSESPQLTQEQLAAKFGFSVDTLQNYKTLLKMIPELEELVDTGIVTPDSKAATEYVRLRGYRHVGDRKSSRQNGALKLSDITAEWLVRGELNTGSLSG